ncbi:MAG: sigma-54-dependent Fis family transcriptional regulator [Acidobacteria bacterium]|nr:MAG: sigma-54-dependent Fis family transcriptional regulator [Acidobacteriota bacterium]
MKDVAGYGEGMPRVLVIDDEPVVQDVLARILSRAGYGSSAAMTGRDGLQLLAEREHDLVILDVMLPDGNGVDILRAIKKANRDLPVIMMTAYGSVDNAVSAMKEGAFHYVTKPFANEEVLLLVEKALDASRLRAENRRLRSIISREEEFEGIVGRSAAIREVFRRVEQIAPSRSTVLVTGESGTGKELVARAIHRRSPRREKPFLPVHSGGIPSDLVEANLFGHVKGAFTGATAAREGIFRAAAGGTVFLDEIGTLRLDLQTKLLRVLQVREFMPVGSTETVSLDVRVLVATNADLLARVKSGEFREDLYYRIKVLEVEVPPLRRRREDIQLLAEHFLEKYSLENGKEMDSLPPETVAVLNTYDWPGNVRELENAIIQGVVMGRGPVLMPEDLPVEVRGVPDGDREGPPTEEDDLLPPGLSLGAAVASYERRLIREALERSSGVQRQAARLLGMRPTTLNEKIKRLGLRAGEKAS